MANIKETVPFSYDEIYAGIQEKFANEGYDTEPGSNTSQLITAMAYLTSMLNVNTAVNVNETILPLATKRNNVLQDARALGYEIQHKRSYTYMLTLSLAAGSHTIPTHTKFEVNSKKYYYFGKQLEYTNVLEGTLIQILVVEGDLFKYTDYPDSLVTTTGIYTDSVGNEVPQYFIDIPYVDVEESGIEVFLTYYDDFGNLIYREEWNRSPTFIIDKDSTLDKQWVRLDNIEFNTPRIYFELSGVGTAPRIGTIIEINALVTTGVDGAIEDLNTPAAITHTLPNMTITKVALVSQGANEESITSIQTNAPKFYNTANRAVTKIDYESICDRQATVNKTMVWGGDDEFPKCPGHIWFSFVPSNYSRAFSQTEFNYEYTLNNRTYTDWDYTLDPTGDAALYQAQLADADVFYDNTFIQNSEIKAYEYTEDGKLIQPGVWDVLDKYKIPTLEFHTRHPIQLDFEYDLSILKYSITDSNSSLHQTVFETIDNFFTGTGDSVQMEKYEAEYFQSSLNKRIDTVLTDVSGHTNTLTTRLMLTKKNVAQENANSDYRDVYIPLAVPFETYFDPSGYLLYNKLPSIDTLDFIEYAGETGQNIFTDWSGIQTDIDNLTTQSTDVVISAPIRVAQSETVVLTAAQAVVPLVSMLVIPDDPTVLDEAIPVFSFDKTVVKLNDVTLVYDTDWTYDPLNKDKITLVGQTVLEADTITVESDVLVGYYHLFNSFKKYILIQMYIDAAGYTETGVTNQYDINTPKAYLTTSDGFYDFSIDSYYLTTEGYSVIDQNDVDAITGNIVKKISPSSYTSSPIKMDLFRKNRYLNLNYNTPNFAVLKNVMPRLTRVTFAQGV